MELFEAGDVVAVRVNLVGFIGRDRLQSTLFFRGLLHLRPKRHGHSQFAIYTSRIAASRDPEAGERQYVTARRGAWQEEE